MAFLQEANWREERTLSFVQVIVQVLLFAQYFSTSGLDRTDDNNKSTTPPPFPALEIPIA